MGSQLRKIQKMRIQTENEMAAFVQAGGVGEKEHGYPYPVFSDELVEKLLKPRTRRSREYNSADTKLVGTGTPLAFYRGSDADKVLLICKEENGIERPIREEETSQVVAPAEYADGQWAANLSHPFSSFTVGVFETSRVEEKSRTPRLPTDEELVAAGYRIWTENGLKYYAR